MIRTFDLCVNAAHPEVKIYEAATFIGSPSTAFVRGVPPAMGSWKITAVRLAAAWPDGSIENATATQTGDGVWAATLQGTDTSGRAENGLQILADGIDETGAAVTGYVIGVCDLAVYTRDATIDVDGQSWYVRLFDSAPTPPHKGDAYFNNGVLMVYDGAQWVTIGGGGGGGIVDDTVTRTSSNAVKSSGIWSAIWGTLTALPTGFMALYDWCVAQLAGKADKSEMSVATSNDTATITLKQGTSVTVITQHQPLPAAVAPSTSAAHGAYADARDTGTALEGKQASITASGILKGNGSGGVTAAVAGTDYQAPLAAYTSTPSAPTTSGSAGSSTEYSRGDHAHPAETLVVTATLNLANMTVTSLSHTFSEILAARQAGRTVLLEANAMTGPTTGGQLIAWCSAEFGSVSGQSLQIGQLWFSAFMYANFLGDSIHTYYGAIELEYDGTATLYLNRLVEHDDLDALAQTVAGKLSVTGETRTVTATDSGGTETYKFAGTGETTDANAIVRVSGLPYVNVGEAEQMLAGVYGILSRGVQRHTATSGETSATFGFADTPGSGKISDAILDIDNSGNTSALGMEFYGLGTTFVLVPPDGDDLAEMTSVDGGKRARFYFTETALVFNNLPVISIQRITLGAVATAITRGS